MADPEPSTGASADRRDRRRERSRRRLKRVLTGFGTVALAIVVVLVATDAVRFGGDERPSLAGTIDRGHHDAATTTTSTPPRQCRALSATEPLKLWVGGDSLAGSLGPSLGAMTGATGVVQPYFDSRVSSGLADPGFFDWPEHATTEMASIDPEVVVFIIGANDWTTVSGDSWKAAYTDKVDTMMKTLIGPGRTVYWLGSPTLKGDDMDAAVVEVNAVAQEVAKRHPKVHYVDTYKLFSDTDGTFAYDLPDETGKVVTMRAGDGVHFTMDGADYLARNVYKLLDAQCAITEQKVEGQAKQVIEAEGSTQVAPGSSSSGSSNGSSSGGTYQGPVQTTPPAPAPSTSPPVVETSPPQATPDPPASSAPPATTTPGDSGGETAQPSSR